MTEFDMEKIQKEAQEIFKEIKNRDWKKFVRLQFDSAIKRQIGKNTYDRRTTLLKSMVIDLLIKRGFIRKRGETEQTLYIVTANDFSSLINDGGYLEKPIYVEYGFPSEVDAWIYYSAQEKTRNEFGLDPSELGVYKEIKIG